LKLIIKDLAFKRLVFQGDITTKKDYEEIEIKYPASKYSRESLALWNPNIWISNKKSSWKAKVWTSINTCISEEHLMIIYLWKNQRVKYLEWGDR